MMIVDRFHSNRSQTKAPTARAGAFEDGIRKIESIAAIYQPPARAPRRRDQSSHIAATVTVAIGRSADKEAWTTPTTAVGMPPTVPAVAAPSGRGGRRQRRGTQRSRGDSNKREFA